MVTPALGAPSALDFSFTTKSLFLSSPFIPWRCGSPCLFSRVARNADGPGT